MQICPICIARVGTDIVGHIVVHHANFYKISFFLFPFIFLLLQFRVQNKGFISIGIDGIVTGKDFLNLESQ